MVGEGGYGNVWKATWRSADVAVKLINGEGSANQGVQNFEDFKAETTIMLNLRPHKNVVLLMGICTEPMALVLEYMEKGSLLDILKSSGKLLQPKLRNKIIKGVIAGMVHLHQEGIIHRDLSSRNILLTQTYDAKVSDFGMSRIMKSVDSGSTKSEVGPFRWMAPEALNDRSYSKAGDVWSFGVLLWECMNCGEMPYQQYEAFQAAHMVANGSLRLDLPQESPKMATLMSNCFKTEPENRPTFAAIDRDFDEERF